MARRQHENHEQSCLEQDKDNKGREDRRSVEMDELGSEVFNLKLALHEYEDRLAKLYQTEDRSKWKGPATLLVSFFFFLSRLYLRPCQRRSLASIYFSRGGT